MRQIQSNPGVSHDQKAQAGLPIRDTQPSAITPNTPTDLTVTAHANGLHELSWNRNGNRRGTQYIVESKTGNDAVWLMVNIVEAASLDHAGNTPGQKIVYRVRARRGGSESPNSNEAGAYLS